MCVCVCGSGKGRGEQCACLCVIRACSRERERERERDRDRDRETETETERQRLETETERWHGLAWMGGGAVVVCAGTVGVITENTILDEERTIVIQMNINGTVPKAILGTRETDENGVESKILWDFSERTVSILN